MNELYRREEVDSPCQNICLIDPESRYCIGCGRTGLEISLWPNMTDDERRSLKSELITRMANHKPRRKAGRARRR